MVNFLSWSTTTYKSNGRGGGIWYLSAKVSTNGANSKVKIRTSRQGYYDKEAAESTEAKAAFMAELTPKPRQKQKQTGGSSGPVSVVVVNTTKKACAVPAADLARICDLNLKGKDRDVRRELGSCQTMTPPAKIKRDSSSCSPAEPQTGKHTTIAERAVAVGLKVPKGPCQFRHWNRRKSALSTA